MMKAFTLAVFACAVMFGVAMKPVAASDKDSVPKGLSSSDWSGILAAYEANRHAAFSVEGGWQARNPSQQWRTHFDGRGFEITPDTGGWTWGLDLTGYGRAAAKQTLNVSECAGANGQRVEYEWDDALTEWYLNDPRGLEHGFVLQRRPVGFNVDAPLQLSLRVRGGLRSRVSVDGRSMAFVNDSGEAVVNYTGLKVFDVTGAIVPAWFELDMLDQQTAIQNPQLIAIVVDDSNAVYPLTIDPVAQQAYLKASNTGTNDYFGFSVAISGNTAVVGAVQESSNATGVNGNQGDNSASASGAAYVFVRSGVVWSQQAYLKASNTGANDYFGYSVALSGDTIVVGAVQEDSNATGVNGNQGDNSASDSGAVYVFVRSGVVWSQQAYLKASNSEASDYFGYSVAVSGDTVIVSAAQESSNATGVNGNQSDNSASASGAAYVFVRSGVAWSQQAYLKASNTESNDTFGHSVAVSGDTAVIGASGEDSNATGIEGNQANNSAIESGAVYVFVRTGGVWSQQAYLKASNTGGGDAFGFSVSISGDTAVVGANGEDSNATGINGNQSDNSASSSGAAYVFVRYGGVWNPQAYLKASNSGAGDSFGQSVAISGDTIVVGAYGEASNATGVNGNQADNSSSGAGAAYVFDRIGGAWSQQSYLKASNTETSDYFGWSVAISSDTAVVSALLEDSNATGVNGNQANNSTADSGAVFVFTGLGPPDADGDGVPDGLDVCPNTPPGLPVDSTGRPHRDCNNDCLVDGADVQCFVVELLSP